MPVLRVALTVAVRHQRVVVEHGKPVLVRLHFLSHLVAGVACVLFDRNTGTVEVLKHQVLHKLLVRVFHKHNVDLVVTGFGLLGGHLVAHLQLRGLDCELGFLKLLHQLVSRLIAVHYNLNYK